MDLKFPLKSHFNMTNDTIQFYRDLMAYPEDKYGDILYECVAPALFGFVSVAGVAGNSLVIYVVCTKHKLRSMTNLLLLNLAVADLSFVLICPPFTAYQFATLHWPFEGALGDALCKTMHYLLNVTAYVTIYTLVLIAALRYATIVHHETNNRRTRRIVVTTLVVGIWVVMLLVNLPILFSYGVQINPYGEPDCENYGRHVGQALYATFFVFAYLLPLSIICGLYIAIQRSFSSGIYMHGTQRAQQQKKYASHLIAAVIVTFAVCWFPVQIHLILAYFSTLPESNFYRTVSVLFNFLAYSNSCVNPFIYNFTSQEFRESFREVICCGAPNVPDNNGSQALVTFKGQSSEAREMVEDPTTARTSLRSDRLNIDDLSSLPSNGSLQRDHEIAASQLMNDTEQISISAYEEESDIHSAMV
jgi:allatostatin receptor